MRSPTPSPHGSLELVPPPVRRPLREVEIADHLWAVFEELAACMSTDRTSLINQAMFVFARLNGFLDHPGPAGGPPPARPRMAPASKEPPLDPAIDQDHDERAARVLRVADQLQRQLSGKGDVEPPDDAPGIEIEQSEPEPEGQESLEVSGLYLQNEDGASERISKPRFIIGRGKNCDLVVDSAKVSRQHATIVREGADYFIEDLKSANGTWFGGRRLTRRKIESGDEYMICNVKIRLVIVA